jgi:hypothetical protein
MYNNQLQYIVPGHFVVEADAPSTATTTNDMATAYVGPNSCMMKPTEHPNRQILEQCLRLGASLLGLLIATL